jgi:hypothetical protein
MWNAEPDPVSADLWERTEDMGDLGDDLRVIDPTATHVSVSRLEAKLLECCPSLPNTVSTSLLIKETRYQG